MSGMMADFCADYCREETFGGKGMLVRINSKDIDRSLRLEGGCNRL